MFNDAALSGKAYDESLQQALALYCTMLANIIENKRLEREARNRSDIANEVVFQIVVQGTVDQVAGGRRQE
ncbi:MAG: hypothetical protein HGB05_16595, partial [Chloroflexi bacterium]|nr:hypothetical protein [Chloroflexota bacterium]